MFLPDAKRSSVPRAPSNASARARPAPVQLVVQVSVGSPVVPGRFLSGGGGGGVSATAHALPCFVRLSARKWMSSRRRRRRQQPRRMELAVGRISARQGGGEEGGTYRVHTRPRGADKKRIGVPSGRPWCDSKRRSVMKWIPNCAFIHPRAFVGSSPLSPSLDPAARANGEKRGPIPLPFNRPPAAPSTSGATVSAKYGNQDVHTRACMTSPGFHS